MKIDEKIERNTAVVTLEGKMMGDPDTLELHNRIRRLMSAGINYVVIDLKPLQWLNSAGLGVLIAGFTTLKKAGGSLVLANVAGKARELIDMTHLNQVFQEYESIEKALEAQGQQTEI
jgi:anti-sigma B factor antagonist